MKSNKWNRVGSRSAGIFKLGTVFRSLARPACTFGMALAIGVASGTAVPVWAASFGTTDVYAAADESGSDEFITNLEALSAVPANLKEKAVSTYRSIIAEGGDAKDAVTESLMEAYPSYKKAIDEVLETGNETAMQALEKMAVSSDRFLAADASFFLGRAYLMSKANEKAVEPLQRLVDDLSSQSLRTNEALYYLGTAQVGLLKTDEASKNLIKFLQNGQDAPERLQAGAYSQLVKLQKIRKDSLHDARQRMGYSQRRLEQAEGGGKTQGEQKKVVKILNKLIKAAEKKECSGSCKNCKKGSKKKNSKPGKKPGGKKPGKGKGKKGGTSQNANGNAERQIYDNGPISIWSKIRDRERDSANSAIKDKLPPEYRKLIERYYREMSDESRGRR